jgi:hypothetical protein
MLFDGEACAKGTAMVAKARDGAMRDPRPQRTTRGGSSGGRAGVALNDRLSRSSRGDARLPRPTFDVRPPNPKSGAKAVMFFEESRADQSVKVVETAEAHSAGAGGPARRDEERELLVFAVAARDGDAEGERNLMRGGSTYWARLGRDGPSWMSTGRPRVMR